jgi:hypothetical protein
VFGKVDTFWTYQAAMDSWMALEAYGGMGAPEGVFGGGMGHGSTDGCLWRRHGAWEHRRVSLEEA